MVGNLGLFLTRCYLIVAVTCFFRYFVTKFSSPPSDLWPLFPQKLWVQIWWPRYTGSQKRCTSCEAPGRWHPTGIFHHRLSHCQGWLFICRVRWKRKSRFRSHSRLCRRWGRVGQETRANYGAVGPGKWFHYTLQSQLRKSAGRHKRYPSRSRSAYHSNQ